MLTDFCAIVPRWEYLPDFNPKPSTGWHGVRALWYEGAPYEGKRTKVFAYIGYPEGEAEKVPAVVLVHGGGGHAFAEWIKKWNQRGFAAIAMETTGFFPRNEWRGLVGTEDAEHAKKYIHELYGELIEDCFTVGPDKGVDFDAILADCDRPIGDQWLYHGVSDVILAHNILRNDPKIDDAKIGVVGISWGAVITSLTIGYDNRFAFAVPIYGSAYLDYLPAPKLARMFGHPKMKALWSAADRLVNAQFPILWQCWCSDVCFSIGANSLSYRATREQAFLCMMFDFGHGHECAWETEAEYRFAECVLSGRLPFVKPVTEPEGFININFEIAVPGDFSGIKAELCYLTEPMNYDESNMMTASWKRISAVVAGKQVFARVPDDACCYFVELKGTVDGKCLISNTALIEKSK